jgi:hypothetical protein
MTDTALATRPGLPEDLKLLVAQFPRETWASHANLGDTAQMWLGRHDMFRKVGGMLSGAISDWREERVDSDGFARFFVPRLNWFLGNLDGHHNVEDHHYFPVFRRAESRLERGFDILDQDHHVIHAALEANAEAAGAFLKALEAGGDRIRYAGEAYADENERLIRLLMRHLDDEEDLIIPVILDRSESGLGIA